MRFTGLPATTRAKDLQSIQDKDYILQMEDAKKKKQHYKSNENYYMIPQSQ